MPRDIGDAIDYIDRDKGVNRGLNALSGLLMSIEQSNAPPAIDIGELLWSINNDLENYLNEARKSLTQ